MGSRSALALAVMVMLACCAAAQPTIDQADDGALEPNGRKLHGLSPFQQKVLKIAGMGGTTGAPRGAVLPRWATLINHAQKNAPGFGRKMLGFGNFHKGLAKSVVLGGATGGPVGAVKSGVTYTATHHAEKRWTGEGLKNWNNPSRW